MSNVKTILPASLAIALSMVTAYTASPVVSNVRASQRPGTKLVDIFYDVADADGGTVTVEINVSEDDGLTYNVPVATLTGQVGSGVSLGSNRQIQWNAGHDWNGNFSSNTRIRVVAFDLPPAPSGMVLIPAGTFSMGDHLGEGSFAEHPLHSVYVSTFFMDKTEVPGALWGNVRSWANSHGYDIPAGTFKGANYPVHGVNWHNAVKWCNARSQAEGFTPCYYTNVSHTDVYKSGSVNISNQMVKWDANGYRLPTEAEWEKAARGGLAGARFPWGQTISHSQANYKSVDSAAYDISPTRGYHPEFASQEFPYTSPVGYFEANGFGLFDMSGNVQEWCWDYYDGLYYDSSSSTDPRGPEIGKHPYYNTPYQGRVLRGGDYAFWEGWTKVFKRYFSDPGSGLQDIGPTLFDRVWCYYGFRTIRK